MADFSKLVRSARRFFHRADEARASAAAWLDRMASERVARLSKKWRTR